MVLTTWMISAILPICFSAGIPRQSSELPGGQRRFSWLVKVFLAGPRITATTPLWSGTVQRLKLAYTSLGLEGDVRACVRGNGDSVGNGSTPCLNTVPPFVRLLYFRLSMRREAGDRRGRGLTEQLTLNKKEVWYLKVL